MHLEPEAARLIRVVKLEGVAHGVLDSRYEVEQRIFPIRKRSEICAKCLSVDVLHNIYVLSQRVVGVVNANVRHIVVETDVNTVVEDCLGSFGVVLVGACRKPFAAVDEGDVDLGKLQVSWMMVRNFVGKTDQHGVEGRALVVVVVVEVSGTINSFV